MQVAWERGSKPRLSVALDCTSCPRLRAHKLPLPNWNLNTSFFQWPDFLPSIRAFPKSRSWLSVVVVHELFCSWFWYDAIRHAAKPVSK
ncbi:hypothetical protein VNO77_18971 [Canavalia gladiata]|uniref:Uncharacterized protein n=1 Tax=Canavalia gladiata TaxID=3824 RepID=A0AAN9LQ68_CANGL